MTAIGIAYALLANIAINAFSGNGVIALVWPPSGLALAALLLMRAKYWPAISLSVFAINLLSGKPIFVCLAFAAGNTIGPLLAVWFLKSNHRKILNLDKPNDYLWLGIVVISSVTMGSFVGCLGLLQAGYIRMETFVQSALHWWTGDLLGMAILTPFILSWRKLPQDWFEGNRSIETLIFIGLAFFTGQAVFLDWFHAEIGTIAQSYWVSIFMLWGAVRFGRHGASLISILMAAEAMLGAAHGVGYFGRDIQESGLLNLQLSMLVVSVTGMVLALVIHELRQSKEQLMIAASVYQTSSEAMLVTDAENRIINVNPAFIETTGYQLDEVVGKAPMFLSSGMHDKAFYQEMRKAILNQGKWQGEIRSCRKNGEIYTGKLSIDTLYHPDGTVRGRIGLFSDISESKKNQEVIWKQANYDLLTELPNRQMVNNRINEEIKKCHREGNNLALIFIDLDRFKDINEALGHEAGDQLLKEASLRMVKAARKTDVVGRLGDDEFVVVLGELDDITDVERIANTVLEELTAPYQLKNQSTYVSASMGIAFYPDDAQDVITLFKCADQALYTAKREGRNCFHYYTPAIQESISERLRLTNDLHSALQENQLMVFYQPIVDLSSGEITKAEALIRWKHPCLGLISPAKFIPLAEESGQIVEIGDWVFKESAHQVARWRSMHPKFQISVNKSPVQFHQRKAHTDWFMQLRKLGLPGQSIVVEITEGLLANDNINEKLLEFRDAGIQVSLDDFGTGYSSLSYLKKFDIDYLKIDQSFVRNLAPDSNDLALCEAIIVMAHKLGIQVIAEGIETAEQRYLLAAADCDYGQGYLFSKPVPADQFEKLLTRR